MNKNKQKVFIVLSLFLVAIFLGVNPLLAKKKHPKLDPQLITEDPMVCGQCHSDQVRAWEKGLHGLNQVRCFICHGDLEKRFERIANPSNCVMCHADKVEDLTKAKEYKTCFACHHGHTLEVKPGSKNIHKK
ncbi:MAG: hypothetical protein ACK4GE_05830 [Caldimicrobium sp.]